MADLRVGPVGGGGAIMKIPYLALTEDFQRSEIFDLTRFPVSDGAGVKCYTFCTILDRNYFFESVRIIFKNVNFFVEHMEMSRIVR